MDRNALLQAARDKFLETFLLAADQALNLQRPNAFQRVNANVVSVTERARTAASELLQNRQLELRTHLRQRMAQLLDRSLQTTYSTFRPDISKDLTSDKLTLIDFNQLENQLLIDEITTRFRNAADHSLRDLNIRIAVLFEQKAIKERENPFRPWLFTQCLVSAIEALGTRPDVTSTLLGQIAAVLEKDVAPIYDKVNAFLAEHGIAAQVRLHRPASDAGTTPVEPLTATPLYNIAPRIASQPDQPVSAGLIQAIQSLYAPLSLAKDAGTAAPTLTTPDTGKLHNYIRDNRDALLNATRDNAERKTIDTVCALLDFIFDDEYIDRPIRSQLARLQLRILEVALTEPGLLTQVSHPARMLINHLGTVALDFSSSKATSQSKRVLADIERMIDNLLMGGAPIRVSFATVLAELNTLISQNFAEVSLQQAHTVRVMEMTQRRLPPFNILRTQLETALSGLIVDPLLRNFLLEAWTLVIDNAQQVEGVHGQAATTLRRLVPELLWSVGPHNDPDNRTQLLTLLPGLTRSIREGLTTIGWSIERQQRTLDWLMQMHRNCLRENLQTAQVPSLQSVRQHFQKFIDGEVAATPALAASTPPLLNFPSIISSNDSQPQRDYMDWVIRRIDLRLRPTTAARSTESFRTESEPPKPLRYVERLPLFERAFEALPR